MFKGVARTCTFPKRVLMAGSAALIVTASLAIQTTANQDANSLFESKVRPTLLSKCIGCHGPKQQLGDLRLDKPITAVQAKLLAEAISYTGDLKMPPSGKLPADELACLSKWAKAGAPWPAAPKANAGKEAFWAFVAPKSPSMPSVKAKWWATNPIDTLVLSKLEQAGLKPAPAADRRTLIRRATFDLIGLPPTPKEIDDFLADKQPNAFERVVDRLLDSKAYGERWGRHWLDVARYADSNGLDENLVYPNAWRYRDWVVNALNSDKPINRFFQEQIAGDLIPDAGDDGIVATGYLALGGKMLAEDDPVKQEMDIIDEQVDTLSKTFLGLTVGCARCHDHKFDPISSKDYYSLAGIFKSTKTMLNFRVVADWNERPLGSKADKEKLRSIEAQIKIKREAVDKKRQAASDALLKELKPKLADYEKAARQLLATDKANTDKAKLEAVSKESNLIPDIVKDVAERIRTGGDIHIELPEKHDHLLPAPLPTELKQLDDEIAALEKSKPAIPLAMAVEDGNPTDLKVCLRGNYLTLGDNCPRRFPAVISAPNQPPLPKDHSGRLELAQWLTSEKNPLTARVFVNRVWRWRFGRGLVASVDNFGLLGDRPTNPELLDYLALSFVKDGWSLKKLQKQMMLTNTYLMSGQYDAKSASLDPDNRLLWRFPRQRLEAEALRDSILSVAGTLDRTMGGSLMKFKPRDYVTSTASQETIKYDSHRRAIYLPVIRAAVYDEYTAFDFGDPTVMNGDRPTTTIAPQALFMLNSSIVLNATRDQATAILKRTDIDDRQRISDLYVSCYGRPASPAETTRALDYLVRFEAVYAKAKDPKLSAWQSLCKSLIAANEFIYVE